MDGIDLRNGLLKPNIPFCSLCDDQNIELSPMHEFETPFAYFLSFRD